LCVARLRLSRYLLADAVWELWRNLTAYGAAYLELARRLDVRLFTLDKGMAPAAHATPTAGSRVCQRTIVSAQLA
jgi:predicted nucleic acid-binding protein